MLVHTTKYMNFSRCYSWAFDPNIIIGLLMIIDFTIEDLLPDSYLQKNFHTLGFNYSYPYYFISLLCSLAQWSTTIPGAYTNIMCSSSSPVLYRECFRFLYKGIIINHYKNRANLH